MSALLDPTVDMWLALLMLAGLALVAVTVELWTRYNRWWEHHHQDAP